MILIKNFLKKLYFLYFLKVKKGKCLFIPHDGICINDKASIMNYKADNCLIFIRYILDNSLYNNKEIVVVSTTHEQAEREEKYCQKYYPNANIHIIPGLNNPANRKLREEWATSEYIFCSEEKFPYKKKKGQHYLCLSYYPISLKNDCYCSTTQHMGYRAQNTNKPDVIVSSSLVNSQIDSAAFELPFYKFLPIGKVRSDALLENENLSPVRNFLQKLCGDYKYSKIILYTPTHRDYERATFDIKRSILGFDVNREKFEQFLKENEILIVCKLHPFQNKQVVDVNLPNGVVNFTGNEKFGLIELMKVSDMLMTDYTSTYVDYLLLDKPVIFNFYDKEMYEKSRGLAFYPFEKICAGEIFTDEASFYHAVKETIQFPNKHANLRKEMTEHLNTYHINVCEKTYDTIFIKGI